MEVKDVMIVEVSQRHHDFKDNVRSLGKDLGILVNVEYITLKFGFPLNKKQYKVALEGDEKQIERFKQLYPQMY